MNNDARNDATKRLVSLNNEATLDAAVYSGASPNPTVGAAASTIAGAILGGGYFLQSDNNDDDFEDEGGFNRDRDKDIQDRKRTMRALSMVNKS